MAYGNAKVEMCGCLVFNSFLLLLLVRVCVCFMHANQKRPIVVAVRCDSTTAVPVHWLHYDDRLSVGNKYICTYILYIVMNPVENSALRQLIRIIGG